MLSTWEKVANSIRLVNPRSIPSNLWLSNTAQHSIPHCTVTMNQIQQTSAKAAGSTAVFKIPIIKFLPSRGSKKSPAAVVEACQSMSKRRYISFFARYPPHEFQFIHRHQLSMYVCCHLFHFFPLVLFSRSLAVTSLPSHFTFYFSRAFLTRFLVPSVSLSFCLFIYSTVSNLPILVFFLPVFSLSFPFVVSLTLS